MPINSINVNAVSPDWNMSNHGPMDKISTLHEKYTRKFLGKSLEKLKKWVRELPEELKNIKSTTDLKDYMQSKKIKSITLAVITEGKVTSVYTVTHMQAEKFTLEHAFRSDDTKERALQDVPRDLQAYDFEGQSNLFGKSQMENIYEAVEPFYNDDLLERPVTPPPDYDGNPFSNVHNYTLSNQTTPKTLYQSVETPPSVIQKPEENYEVIINRDIINGRDVILTSEQSIKLEQFAERIKAEEKQLDKLTKRILDMVGALLEDSSDMSDDEIKKRARSLPPEQINDFAALFFSRTEKKKKIDEMVNSMKKVLNLFEIRDQAEKDITTIPSNYSPSTPDRNA